MALPDLFEIPVPWVDASQYEFSSLSSRSCMRRPLQQSVTVHPLHLATDTQDFLDFAQGRTYVFRMPPSWESFDLLRIVSDHPDPAALDRCKNLALYSSSCFFDQPTKEAVWPILNRICPLPPHIAAAHQIAAELGEFDVIHIGAGDYSAGEIEELARRVEHRFRPHVPLLVLASGGDLPLEVRAVLPPCRLLVEWMERERRDLLSALPHHGRDVVDLVAHLVAVRAKRFTGTFGSTRTALIQRWRLQSGASEKFLFLSSVPPSGWPVRQQRRLSCACGDTYS